MADDFDPRVLCICGHEWMEHSDTWGCVASDDCSCSGFTRSNTPATEGDER